MSRSFGTKRAANLPRIELATCYSARVAEGPRKGSVEGSVDNCSPFGDGSIKVSHLCDSHAVDAVLPSQVPAGKEKFET